MKLPPRVKEKHGRYYLLEQSAERGAGGRLKRLWKPLSRVKDGPAALYDALAGAHRDQGEHSMLSVVAAWKRDKLPDYAPRTRKEYERMAAHVSAAFKDFDIRDIRPKDVADLVDQWKDTPRAGNAYRALVSLIMAYGVRKGLRDDNPVREIAGFGERGRKRYLTDDELEAIRGKASEMTRCLIDLALVTGQRIGDLLALRWADVKPDGIVFRPSKTKGSTGVAVPIRMTPRLMAILERARTASKVTGLLVITTRKGQRLTYHGAHSAWRRACESAGIEDAHFHDVRHRALTDAERQGKDSRRLGGHSTKAQTRQYIEAAGLDWIDPPEAAKR